jgi:hypothetical protein
MKPLPSKTEQMFEQMFNISLQPYAKILIWMMVRPSFLRNVLFTRGIDEPAG